MITPDKITKSQIVVDTDVVSYFLKQDTRAEFFRYYLQHKMLAISFMTVAELYYWAIKRTWGIERIIEMENRIKNYTVLPYDYDICKHWATARFQCEKLGLPSSESDLWVVASALRYDCALATNNGKHYQGIMGLEIICPSLM